MVLTLLAGCADEPGPTATPRGPHVSLERVGIQWLPCRDPCGVTLTYRTVQVDTGEPASTVLRLSGPGDYPPLVQTHLPEGQGRFTWQYPRPAPGATATYRLSVCPEVGSCHTTTATIGAPLEE